MEKPGPIDKTGVEC